MSLFRNLNQAAIDANFMQMNAYVEDPKMLLIWLKYHAKKDNQTLEVLAKSLSLDWVLS